FAAEAERANATEIVELADLRRGMPLEREHGVFAGHAATVVAYLDAFSSTVLEQHVDRMRAGVDRVLHQLLDDRCGTLDHLTGGDLVHQLGSEDVDAGHS